MEKNTIKLIKKISSFKIISEDGLKKNEYPIGQTYKFPFAQKQIVEIEDNIKFSFQFDIYQTRIIKLSKADFENHHIDYSILNEFEKQFSLIKKHTINPEYFSLYFKDANDFGTCIAAFQRKGDRTYLLLYSTKREPESRSIAEDLYADNVIYINCIWEVKLLSVFYEKVFGNDNSS